MYSNTLINITKKRKSKSIITNTEYHDTRGNGLAPVGGSQIAEYRIYNTEIVETVQGFNKYIKKHGHVGYNGADEIKDREKDFVIPRITKDTCLMDTMIISPGFRIPASEEAIEEFMRSGNMQFFYEYINEFMKNDPKLKDCKVLSAIVHFDEVHFPKSEYDDEGKWVRDYTDEESMALAYIPVHMHVNYLPLTRVVDKEGREYLKLTHKEIWKSEKGKYWQSYKEFNDRQFAAVGKKYGLSRGNIWEDWKTRIQEAENGKKAKQKRDLTDFIMDREQERVDGIKRQQSQLQEEVKILELDVKDYQVRIDRLKAQLIDAERKKKQMDVELEDKKIEHKKNMKRIEETSKKEIEEYQKAIDEAQAKALDKIEAEARAVIVQKKAEIRKQEETLSKKSLELEDKEKLLAEQIAQLENMRETAERQRILTEQAIEKAMKEYDEATEQYKASNLAKRILADIESGMRAGKLSLDEAIYVIKTKGLNDAIKHYTPQEYTPNLNNLHEKSLRTDWDDR